VITESREIKLECYRFHDLLWSLDSKHACRSF